MRRIYCALMLATSCAPARGHAKAPPSAANPDTAATTPSSGAEAQTRERVVTDEHTIGLPPSQTDPQASPVVSVIRGRATDSGGLPLEGVAVIATSPALQGSQSAITGRDGNFVLTNLPPGEYVVTLYYGDIVLKKPGVRVTAGRPIFLIARLEDPSSTERVPVPQRSHVVPTPTPCATMTSRMAGC